MADEMDYPFKRTVNKKVLEALMTCPICNKFYDEATTISVCIHSFCKKCIVDKITEEKLGHCPVCSSDLGEEPLKTLKPDYNLKDIRSQVFPSPKSSENAGKNLILGEGSGAKLLEPVKVNVSDSQVLKEKQLPVYSIETVISPRASLNVADFISNLKKGSIWFALVAVESQEGLPKIPREYIRIRDENAPIKVIHEYLKKKLNLDNTFGFLMTLLGCPVVADIPIKDCVEIWMEYASAEDKARAISGEDVFLELTYMVKE